MPSMEKNATMQCERYPATNCSRVCIHDVFWRKSHRFHFMLNSLSHFVTGTDQLGRSCSSAAVGGEAPSNNSSLWLVLVESPSRNVTGIYRMLCIKKKYWVVARIL